jgi:hypothetical protein
MTDVHSERHLGLAAIPPEMPLAHEEAQQEPGGYPALRISRRRVRAGIKVPRHGHTLPAGCFTVKFSVKPPLGGCVRRMWVFHRLVQMTWVFNSIPPECDRRGLGKLGITRPFLGGGFDAAIISR